MSAEYDQAYAEGFESGAQELYKALRRAKRFEAALREISGSIMYMAAWDIANAALGFPSDTAAEQK
jgi:hypothetical protein